MTTPAHTAPTRRVPHGVTTPLLLVLALLAAVAPFATDLYLPAFPQMTTELGTDATGVQLTLTAFLVGVAAGQLVFGPISDRLGRKAPLVAGAALFVISSVVVVLAPNAAILTAARAVQGVSGAAGMVLGRAIISDLATGQAAARAFSLMMIVGGVAPVVAPLAGGFLTGPLGWRGVLAVVLALAVLMLVAVLAVVRETHPVARRAALAAERPGGASRELRSRGYVGFTAAFAFAFAVMMAYISASPFVYQDMMGLSETQYGLMFGLNALALVVTSALSARLVGRFGPRALAGAGIATSFAASLVLLALVATDVPAGWFALPLFVAVGSLGFVFGNATALALGYVPHAAGSASAVLGAAQFGLAAAVSPIVGLAGEDNALPLALTMTGAGLIALVAYGLARRAPHAAG
ncbi:multidrug effflux MFS transporter [Microbacterium sp. ZXX196]|uniref:multidrug effflux MFS transporter n=1 Tax=Microbacterium sp. ZXX196 TaxID=2609291 RepID=UPI0012B9E9B6|nr:multidrug effflux MFS transporter [Microbacterium sp. ZXX196]MTE23781.1 Bcr/CflA family efflux MFS transporter [Microbacterium sp. ZXX196]